MGGGAWKILGEGHGVVLCQSTCHFSVLKKQPVKLISGKWLTIRVCGCPLKSLSAFLLFEAPGAGEVRIFRAFFNMSKHIRPLLNVM